MKAKRIYLILFVVCLVLSIALAVSAVLTASDKPEGTPVFSDGLQYGKGAAFEGGYLVGGRNNTLRAVGPDGSALWEDASLSNVVVSLCVHGNTAYAASGNKVYSYDLATGARQICAERYETGGNSVVFANITDIALSDDGTMLAVSHGSSKSRHNLTLLELGSGRTLFTQSVGVTADSVEFEGGGSLLLGSDSGNIRRYSLSGEVSDVVRLSDDVADVDVYGENIYAATSGGDVVVISGQTGEILFGASLSARNALAAPCRVTAGEDGVFVGSSDGTLYAFDLSLAFKSEVRFAGDVADIFRSGEQLCVLVSGQGMFSYPAEALLRGASALFWVFLAFGIALFIAAFVFLILRFPKIGSAFRKTGRVVWKHKTAYGMLLPIFGLLAVFGFYPVLVAALRAFTDWSSSSLEINFIGFDNFRMMITEGYFLTGIRNLLIFLASYMVKILTVPLLVAVMVYSLVSDRSKYAFRYLFVLPMVVPSVVSALMWKNIYDPNFGLLNEVLALLHLEQYQTSWLSNPSTAIPALIFVGFPFIDPFSFLIYYSAMMNIPSSTLEAAQLDGASPVRRFFFIILPMIASQIKVLIMLGFINQIQDFNLILLLTKGGPGTDTYVPGYELYLNATTFGRYGYACALGLLMFVVIFVGTIILNKVKVNQEVEG